MKDDKKPEAAEVVDSGTAMATGLTQAIAPTDTSRSFAEDMAILRNATEQQISAVESIERRRSGNQEPNR